ncbi:mechanosensitive ion channel family protein [Prosthecomicrobium pneumaticum]|uniref:Small-conductance mechanosensitive channel n=1 Tax=Prosthecomicrobium pneumaticum TaxID=81895 RepID=A0A7W9FPU3_9HYPH|nr:mechanosensitive ion channel domain-containing protein [Prosthecomicrobium pneumaticum]MBB5754592.1 small conductance mechanosensitive channel [Prosthecomicrobium pneumaticum]
MEQQAADLVLATRTVFAGLGALAVQYAFAVVGAVVLIAIGWIAARILQRWAYGGLSRVHGIDETIARFVSGAVRYGVIILFMVMVLGQFGVQTASIVAALGAAGLAIGLALQGTLQNIAAGIMLLVLRPFRVGEYIDTGTVSGTVAEIGLFATELRTPDGLYRLAPNSLLWPAQVTNFSRATRRREELTIRIAYEDDVDKALALMRSVILADPRVEKDAPPDVFVAELAESAVLLRAWYWAPADVWWWTTRDIVKKIKESFDASGITMPYPQVTYHVQPRPAAEEGGRARLARGDGPRH